MCVFELCLTCVCAAGVCVCVGAVAPPAGADGCGLCRISPLACDSRSPQHPNTSLDHKHTQNTLTYTLYTSQ